MIAQLPVAVIISCGAAWIIVGGLGMRFFTDVVLVAIYYDVLPGLASAAGLKRVASGAVAPGLRPS